MWVNNVFVKKILLINASFNPSTLKFFKKKIKYLPNDGTFFMSDRDGYFAFLKKLDYLKDKL